MPRFPLFGYPYRYPYYPYYSSPKQFNNKTPSENIEHVELAENKDRHNNEAGDVQAKNRYTKSTPIFPFSFNIDGLSDNEQPIIEILGIKLYQDDLIILGLLFFLYKEEVKDEMLFISLILLLLT